MQIKKRNRKSSRRASRKSHSRKACRSRTAYRKASRKSCRSARRRMGGAMPMMIVHQSPHADFEIMFNPDIEVKYDEMLNHPKNQFKEYMAPTFADQRNGTGVYMFKISGLEAYIVPRHTELEKRLAELKASD